MQPILSSKHALIGSNPRDQPGTSQPNTHFAINTNACVGAATQTLCKSKQPRSIQTGSLHRCHSTNAKWPLTPTWWWVHPTVSHQLESWCSYSCRMAQTGRYVHKRIRAIRVVVFFLFCFFWGGGAQMGTGACLSCTAAVISGPDARQSKALSSVVTEAWDTTTSEQANNIQRCSMPLY